MALRQLGRSLRSVVPALEARAASSSGVFSSVRSFGSAEAPAEVPAEHGPATTPTVFDKLITINVVDMTGHRHVVRSLVGKTLVEALVEAGFPETYFFPNMGYYTQHMDDAHVFIPEQFWSKMPTFEDDSPEAGAIKRMFRDIVQEYAKETSYFASYINLTPEMNGMNIGIGPIKPWILHPERSFDGVHDSPISKFSHRTNEIFS
uniref:Uncharacterized protein n=1 Tax=Chlamydomonas euryale TaxID=1486919 RepID=A0A7R9V0H6_9CHLO|mmetsp:Transcript_12581/g.36755  ORF Transcript_12581/g.36755 Transcript_12581/m.36755 type:complete len:205 (+) Transcript_12581:133-747(+)